MTGLETASDTEIIESLEFAPEIGCEGVAGDPDCPRPADYFLRCRICHHPEGPICDHHVQWLRWHASRFTFVHCGACGASRRSWDEIGELFPIRGGAS